MIESAAGKAAQQQLREVFLALMELDKHNPREVIELMSAAVSTIRSWKPQALLARVDLAPPTESA